MGRFVATTTNGESLPVQNPSISWRNWLVADRVWLLSPDERPRNRESTSSMKTTEGASFSESENTALIYFSVSPTHLDCMSAAVRVIMLAPDFFAIARVR